MLTSTTSINISNESVVIPASNSIESVSHTHSYGGVSANIWDPHRYDYSIRTKELNNQKVMLYEALGIPKESIKYETEFVNKTKQTYLNIVGKAENEELDFKNDINVHMLIDTEIYDRYEVHVDNGLVTVILHEIKNETPVLVDCRGENI